MWRARTVRTAFRSDDFQSVVRAFEKGCPSRLVAGSLILCSGRTPDARHAPIPRQKQNIFDFFAWTHSWNSFGHVTLRSRQVSAFGQSLGRGRAGLCPRPFRTEEDGCGDVRRGCLSPRRPLRVAPHRVSRARSRVPCGRVGRPRVRAPRGARAAASPGRGGRQDRRGCRRRGRYGLGRDHERLHPATDKHDGRRGDTDRPRRPPGSRKSRLDAEKLRGNSVVPRGVCAVVVAVAVLETRASRTITRSTAARGRPSAR